MSDPSTWPFTLLVLTHTPRSGSLATAAYDNTCDAKQAHTIQWPIESPPIHMPCPVSVLLPLHISQSHHGTVPTKHT